MLSDSDSDKENIGSINNSKMGVSNFRMIPVISSETQKFNRNHEILQDDINNENTANTSIISFTESKILNSSAEKRRKSRATDGMVLMLSGQAYKRKQLLLGAQHQAEQANDILQKKETEIKNLESEVHTLRTQIRGSDGQITLLKFQLQKNRSKSIVINNNTSRKNDTVSILSSSKYTSPDRQSWLLHFRKSQNVLDELMQQQPTLRLNDRLETVTEGENQIDSDDESFDLEEALHASAASANNTSRNIFDIINEEEKLNNSFQSDVNTFMQDNWSTTVIPIPSKSKDSKAGHILDSRDCEDPIDKSHHRHVILLTEELTEFKHKLETQEKINERLKAQIRVWVDAQIDLHCKLADSGLPNVGLNIFGDIDLLSKLHTSSASSSSACKTSSSSQPTNSQLHIRMSSLPSVQEKEKKKKDISISSEFPPSIDISSSSSSSIVHKEELKDTDHHNHQTPPAYKDNTLILSHTTHHTSSKSKQTQNTPSPFNEISGSKGYGYIYPDTINQTINIDTPPSQSHRLIDILLLSKEKNTTPKLFRTLSSGLRPLDAPAATILSTLHRLPIPDASTQHHTLTPSPQIFPASPAMPQHEHKHIHKHSNDDGHAIKMMISNRSNNKSKEQNTSNKFIYSPPPMRTEEIQDVHVQTPAHDIIDYSESKAESYRQHSCPSKGIQERNNTLQSILEKIQAAKTSMNNNTNAQAHTHATVVPSQQSRIPTSELSPISHKVHQLKSRDFFPQPTGLDSNNTREEGGGALVMSPPPHYHSMDREKQRERDASISPNSFFQQLNKLNNESSQMQDEILRFMSALKTRKSEMDSSMNWQQYK